MFHVEHLDKKEKGVMKMGKKKKEYWTKEDWDIHYQKLDVSLARSRGHRSAQLGVSSRMSNVNKKGGDSK